MKSDSGSVHLDGKPGKTGRVLIEDMKKEHVRVIKIQTDRGHVSRYHRFLRLPGRDAGFY